MNANITVLKDESLGGIEREYREVKRKADVGERIVFDSDRPGVTEGRPYDVRGGDHDGAEFFDDDGTRRWQRHVGANCYVIEPTDIVRINTPDGDGKTARFRMVDRKAAVGERVIVTDVIDNYGFFSRGNIGVFGEGDWVDFNGQGNVGYDECDGIWRFGHNNGCSKYRVLEPVETEPLSAKPAPDQAAEIIAKLTGRVAVLEQRVAALETAEVTDEGVAEISRIALDPPVFSGTAKLSRVKSPQEIRDDIVKRAKEDVARLVDEDGFAYRRGISPPTIVVEEFVVNRDKRTVVVLGFEAYGNRKKRALGFAKCAPGDVFNSHIGRAIALRRALGLEIPEEYVSAPQPTEFNCGDIIKWDTDVSLYTIGQREGKRVFISGGVEYPDSYTNLTVGKYVRIVDDSRESDNAEPRKEVA